MFSATLLYNELNNFRKETYNYINREYYVESYYFHKSEGKIFNADGLKDYLRNHPIKNDLAYQDISNEAHKIIDIYNEFENKQIKPWNNNLIKSEELKSRFFSNVYVELISIEKNSFKYHNYIDEYIREYNYEHITFNQIAHRCLKILNILESFGHGSPKLELQNSFTISKDIEIGALCKKRA